MARLLDEPESTVNSLAGGTLTLPICYGTFSFAYQKRQWDGQVSYCPECRKFGYHASFHDVWWLAQCPIHRVDLVHCNINQPYGVPVFDAYGKELWNIFDRGTEKWLSICDSSRVASLLASSMFREFHDWLQSVHLYANRCMAMNVISIYGEGYTDRDLGALLGRLEWSHPLPNRLSKIFKEQPLRQEPAITECGVKAARHLKDILNIIDYDSLSNFFRKTFILNKETPPARQLVVDAVKKLVKHETPRKTSWGWLRNVGWIQIDPNGWPYWQIVKSNKYLIRRLREKWIDFFEEDSSNTKIQNEWYEYHEWANILHKKGIVEPLRKHLLDDATIYMSNRIQPLVKFSIGSDVRELLELLLYYEASADVEDTYLWLESIREGRAPYNFPLMTASNGNLFLEDQKAYFMVWPRVRRCPAGYDVREIQSR
ncbi:hypothetical protein [Dechloromonas denitrificans]|uniref:hypothetical protein n=1 Tax=Dechloromonas denitrificans TaxID=281362 RepID=UPI001CF88FB2|nr:hypothetical protein [Dechloromonas denitrificans]UCV05662.1 hypothetical protein KI611_10595 [Dechloromonas denitrificans]